MQRQFRLHQERGAGGQVSGRDSADAHARRSGPSLLDEVVRKVPMHVGVTSVPFHMLAVSSQFQPILNVDERRVEGYEGLIRGHNMAGQPLPPETLFSLARDAGDTHHLDLLARALHIRAFSQMGASAAPLLYLNVYPEAAGADLHDESLFAGLIRHYQIDPSRLVIEILETGVEDEARLKDAVQLYRHLGCRVALDDFGVGFSNFDRLWRLEPDIVKIDRSVMRSASQDPSARRVLHNMVRMIHECGATAVIEGVEERRDALIALETDADFLQGFYFARPSAAVFDSAVATNMLSALVDELEQGTPLNRSSAAPALREYAWLVENMAEAMERGTSFALACDALLRDSLALRVSLHNALGERIGCALNVKHVSAADVQTRDCPGVRGWQLMQLVRATLAEPGIVRLTRASPSVSLHEECVTLSCCVVQDGQPCVLCVDVHQPGSRGTESMAAGRP
ncbi:MAG: EAL domain-containing protein [Betaproteobacteria bacterium]|nr:EAL domain-containing protein [Betaproteobacteria bacterium]